MHLQSCCRDNSVLEHPQEENEGKIYPLLLPVSCLNSYGSKSAQQGISPLACPACITWGLYTIVKKLDSPDQSSQSKGSFLPSASSAVGPSICSVINGRSNDLASWPGSGLLSPTEPFHLEIVASGGPEVDEYGGLGEDKRFTPCPFHPPSPRRIYLEYLWEWDAWFPPPGGEVRVNS
jgi:hypothetical protein